MKKTITLFLVLLMCISGIVFAFCGCSKKHDVYEIETDLGDQLSFEVYLSGNLHGMYLTYVVSSKTYTGADLFRFKDKTVIPDDPLESFKTIGTYGSTNFYKLYDKIIYIYNNKYLGQLDPQYSLEGTLSRYQEWENDRIEMINAVISDIIKTNNFDYIYQFGPILAYEGNEEIKQQLQRYARGEFNDEEISTNQNSLKTAEEMVTWAQKMLNEYYSQ